MPRGDPARSRRRLLDAGHRLAAGPGLSRLRVEDVTAAAGLAKGTFYLHFADRSALFVALHQDFHARAREAVAACARGLVPGLQRLLAGTATYLQVCREHASVRAILIDVRALPEIQAQIELQNRHFEALAIADFAAMGYEDAAAAAAAWIGMAVDVALAESRAGGELAARRALLERFARSRPLTPPSAPSAADGAGNPPG